MGRNFVFVQQQDAAGVVGQIVNLLRLALVQQLAELVITDWNKNSIINMLKVNL